MRRQEAELFNRPYEHASGDVGERFASALGIELLGVRALASEVFGDLDPNVFGIGWWSAYPNLGDKRRILIGDYLYCSIDSIELNLTEAKLHLLELLDWWERQSILIADAVAPDPRTGELKFSSGADVTRGAVAGRDVCAPYGRLFSCFELGARLPRCCANRRCWAPA
jgi:hypothetical protein